MRALCVKGVWHTGKEACLTVIDGCMIGGEGMVDGEEGEYTLSYLSNLI